MTDVCLHWNLAVISRCYCNSSKAVPYIQDKEEEKKMCTFLYIETAVKC